MKRFEALSMWQRVWRVIRWHRTAAVLLVTVAASGMAVAGWAIWSSASAAPVSSTLRSKDGGAGMAADPQVSPRDQHEFEHQCLDVMRDRLFRAALRQCEAFLPHPLLGAAAHTVMAVIYNDAGYRDTQASIGHTQRAAELGDPRALFLLALHVMAGNMPGVQIDPGELLQRAKAGGVAKANLHLQALRDAQQCRREASARPLGQPLFCMSRAEVHRVLTQQGMPLRRRDDLHWQDEFSPGDVLADAQSVRVQFDVDPRDNMHRLARLSYVFDNAKPERRTQLLASLVKRYGAPAVQPAAPDESAWSLPDGIVVRLQGSRTEGLWLLYEHGQRWRGRQQHLQSQQAQMELDRVKADASVL